MPVMPMKNEWRTYLLSSQNFDVKYVYTVPHKGCGIYDINKIVNNAIDLYGSRMVDYCERQYEHVDIVFFANNLKLELLYEGTIEDCYQYLKINNLELNKVNGDADVIFNLECEMFRKTQPIKKVGHVICESLPLQIDYHNAAFISSHSNPSHYNICK